jgi:predicted ATP-binding protein involved in virulence
MYELKTWRNPYDAGFSTCSKRQIEIEEGMTVLVGCNGSGKTTLIHNIKTSLEKENIPYYYFDNLTDGGANARSNAFARGDFEFVACTCNSSEGENITMNLSEIVKNMKEFIVTGETPKSKRTKQLHMLFSDEDETDNTPKSNKRFILMDAVDSGYSIDNVVDLKNLLHRIMDTAKKNGIELYIILAANEYELAANEPCMDVTNGKYMRFDTYEAFKSFILKSRKKKDARIERVIAKNEKKQAKKT